jgi:Tol biopolymer transport system component
MSYLSDTVSWAPDSRRLAYLEDGSLQVFDLADRTCTDMGAEADAVAWSPDGDWIA